MRVSKTVAALVICALCIYLSDAYKIDNNDVDSNDIDDDRIQVNEPFKTMIITSTKFALAQTRLPKYMQIDTAITILNNFAYMMSKPAVLIKVVKFVGVAITTIISATFFFPQTSKWMNQMLRGKIDTLQYLSNGLSERSIVDMVNSRSDDALNSIGLDTNCRQRSVCLVGSLIGCAYPDAVTFVPSRLESTGLKENIYTKAFTQGLVNRTCTNIVEPKPDCFEGLIGSLVSARTWPGDHKTKYQALPVTTHASTSSK